MKTKKLSKEKIADILKIYEAKKEDLFVKAIEKKCTSRNLVMILSLINNCTITFDTKDKKFVSIFHAGQTIYL